MPHPKDPFRFPVRFMTHLGILSALIASAGAAWAGGGLSCRPLPTDTNSAIRQLIRQTHKHHRNSAQTTLRLADGSFFSQNGDQAYAYSADGSYHYYRSGGQVSESLMGASGGCYYYENSFSISLQDLRNGQYRREYISKDADYEKP